MIFRLVILLLLSLRLAGPAAAQGESQAVAPTVTEADYAAVGERALAGYIIPAYGNLQASTRRLTEAVERFCATPGLATRDPVQTGFAGALDAWAAVDFLRFGPMAEDGRGERFAYWPDVHGTGARQLRQFLASQDAGLLEPGALARQSAAVQGLPALESLLYSGKQALLVADAPEAFRCRLAVAVARNLDDISASAVSGWSSNGKWAGLLLHPGPDNPVYRTHGEVMTEVLRAVLTGLEQDRDHRLVPALGTTPEEAKANLAPYNRSGMTLRYLSSGANSLALLVHVSGLLDLLPEAQGWIANSVDFEFANLKRALDAAGPDFEAALADRARRGQLVYAAIVLASLREIFQVRVAPAAGLTPGFNSLDGD